MKKPVKSKKPTKKKVAKSVRAPKAVAKKTVKKAALKKSAVKKTVAKKAAVKKAKKVAVRKPAKKVPVKKVVVAAPVAPKPVWPAEVEAVLLQLDDAKAEQIVTIDLSRRSSIADTMVVASGRSNRHVNAIADQVVEQLEKLGKKNLRVEGIPQCDWVLVDAGDLVVHVFRPEVRSFYNLEKLWSEAAP